MLHGYMQPGHRSWQSTRRSLLSEVPGTHRFPERQVINGGSCSQGAITAILCGVIGNQAGCLDLVINAVVTWNTIYMAAVIDRLRAEGRTMKDEDIARLSPGL